MFGSALRAVLSAVLLLHAAAPASAAVTVLRTLGADDDGLFLHGPRAVTFAADGTVFLLNGGESQVLHLDRDWNLLEAFGSPGQGPGEIENPVGMILLKDEIRVFEMARITVFGRDGAYRRTLVPGVQYARPAVLDGRIAAVLGAGERPAAFLDDAGRVVSSFGPACPVDFFAAFKACRLVQILPHDAGLCLLLNPLEGTATLVDRDGEAAWTRTLVKAEDTSRYSESADGSEVSMSVTFAMGLGARDAAGDYWFVLPPVVEEGTTYLRRTDADLARIGPDLPLPDGVSGAEVAFAPDGALVLVSPGESLIHLCRVGDDG